ncbi:MAG: GxxExxY protein, partial [Desulfococcaceae bacterium]
NGCLFNVHNALGNIWNEDVYEKALESEMTSQGLSVQRQKEFEVAYFDQKVGHYRTDLLVEDTVIVELKAVHRLLPLHRAQLISYLKGFGKPLGILANFGGASMEHATYPNKTERKKALTDQFDFEKIQMNGKEEIKDLLLMANRILVNLGPGYLHQIYRRALYWELKQSGVAFETAKTVIAKYRNEKVGEKAVNFFIIGNLLLSAVAAKELDNLIVSRFRNYIRHFHLKRGLIINFNAVHLDFRYLTVS